jgi:hypothetical protein
VTGKPVTDVRKGALRVSLADGFYRLFQSSTRSYGVYRLQVDAKPDNKGKITGQARTVHEAVTPALFRDHLDGVIGLGLTPILEGGLATWGAVDFDVYPIDLAQLAQRVALLQIPLVVVRSKSGGAHLYLFLTEPAPAALVRAKLKDWSIALGAPSGVEIFPKQDALDDANLGSWINLPYQAGARSTRYAHDALGVAVGADDFLHLAAASAVTPTALKDIYPVAPPVKAPPDRTPGALPPTLKQLEPEDPNDRFAAFRDGFSCLIPVLETGVPAAKNLFVFHLTVYSKLKYSDDHSEDRVRGWVRDFFTDPVPERELRTSIRSAL